MHFVVFCKAYQSILFLQHFLNILESVFKKSQLGLTSSQIFMVGITKIWVPLGAHLEGPCFGKTPPHELYLRQKQLQNK
jgi:hypothetical protein